MMLRCLYATLFLSVILAHAVLTSGSTAGRTETIMPSKKNDAPWFCHGLDCPEFTVSDTIGDIQKRQYVEGTWASTNISNISYKKALSVGFWKLFNYISGENENGSKIAMTAPVKVKLIPSQGPFCEDTFIMSFFVSPDFKGAPPKPKNPEVFIETIPATEYWVGEYGGFSSEKDVIATAQKMIATLDESGSSYVADHFFSAGYDSPFRLINRHNEVWIPVKALTTLESS